MCLSLLAFQVSRRFPFLLLHNRDEYRNRPFQPSHFWEHNPNLLGGKDLKSEGMWLGVSLQGRFSSVTNFREPVHNPKALSRGFLVKDFLLQNQSPEAFIQSLDSKLNTMNPFNLFLGDINSPWYFSSRLKKLTPLTPGIYGLSNAELDTPWPKVVKAKAKLKLTLEEIEGQPSSNLMAELTENSVGSFFKLLEDRQLASPEELPSTGIDPKMERALSPIFIALPQYGTLTSSVLIADAQHKITFFEKTHSTGTVQKWIFNTKRS